MVQKPDSEESLASLVTRGFSGLQEALRDRDEKVAQLSDRMIGVEFKIGQLQQSLGRVESDISKAETESLKHRVTHLEACFEKLEGRATSDLNWRRGLLASIILLLLGFLLNFVRISLK